MHRFSLYSPLSAWKKGDYLTAPFVSLSLGTYSTSEEGRVLLSPELMTDREVDETVDQLKSELEEFRRSAKQELHVFARGCGTHEGIQTRRPNNCGPTAYSLRSFLAPASGSG